MAMVKRKRTDTNIPVRYCSECEESYDWHSNDIHGNPILCRCRYYKEGVWSKFLNDRACERFVERSKL